MTPDILVLVIAVICVVALGGWLVVFLLKGIAMVLGYMLLGLSRLFGGNSRQ